MSAAYDAFMADIKDINEGAKSTQNKIIESIGSIPAYIDELLNRSCIESVSDIHIDPQAKHTVVQFRTAGSMRTLESVGYRFHEEIIGRIKILSRLRTDVHDKGQDGRFTFVYKNKVAAGSAATGKEERIDVRVSILPTFYGENAVLRILRPEHGRMQKFTELGMTEGQAGAVFEELERHQGMIILAGPTGCGKTTTIYTMISALVKSARNVVTIEDPIEYLIPGVRQIQILDHADFGFSKALRSILRQDPDVIVVGEMRDSETASLAFQAALTGHLVITSLHAEDSAGVCSRLRDLGISKDLLHSLSLVVSQRLVSVPGSSSAAGGRAGIFEVLPVQGKVKLALFQNSFPEYIRLTLHKCGAKLLYDSASAAYERAGMKLSEKIKKSLGLPLYEATEKIVENNDL